MNHSLIVLSLIQGLQNIPCVHQSKIHSSSNFSLRASSPFGGYREKYTRERHARLASLAQIGELAHRLFKLANQERVSEHGIPVAHARNAGVWNWAGLG